MVQWSNKQGQEFIHTALDKEHGKVWVACHWQYLVDEANM